MWHPRSSPGEITILYSVIIYILFYHSRILIIICRRYDKECDLWSIGVVTFVLLSGYPPFYGDTEAEIFAAVKRGVFEFRSPEWDPISDLAKDFIRSLLQKDPAKRPTPQVSCRGHVWV